MVYARLKPKGILKTYLLGMALGFWRACAWIFSGNAATSGAAWFGAGRIARNTTKLAIDFGSRVIVFSDWRWLSFMFR